MRRHWKQASLGIATWEDGGVRKYKPTTIRLHGGREASPYDNNLLKHVVTNVADCCIVAEPYVMNINYGVPIITDPYIENINPGEHKPAVLVCTAESDILRHIAAVEDVGKFDIVLWLVVVLTELTIEDVLKKGYVSPFNNVRTVALWRQMMENTADRRYSYSDLYVVESMPNNKGKDYMKALAMRHLYSSSFSIDDARVSETLRRYYVAPDPTRSSDPVTTLSHFDTPLSVDTTHAGIDACLRTLMRIYEIDGARVMRAVLENSSERLSVIGACPGCLTVNEVAEIVNKKPAEVRKIIIETLKDVEKLAMQDSGLTEEVWCALPGANIF